MDVEATPAPIDPRAGLLAALARTDFAGAQVCARLEAEGIPTLLLKGRAFAIRLYDNVWERPYSDTDVLVRLKDRAAAERLIANLGFARVDRDADRLGEPGYAMTFARPDGALIDLHWNLSGVEASATTAWDVLGVRTIDRAVGGRVARVPDDATTALLAVLHNAHHGARWGSAASDLERAIERIGMDSWLAARAMAERLRALDAFSAGLLLSTAGRSLAVRLQLSEHLDMEYRLRAEETSFPTWALHRVGVARGVARWRAVAEVVAPPPGAMRAHHPLARRGAGGLIAAYLIRPFRLLRLLGPASVGYLHARRSR